MPNKNKYGNNVDRKKRNAGRHSQTRNTLQSPGNRDRSTSRARSNSSNRTSESQQNRLASQKGRKVVQASPGPQVRNRSESITRRESSAQKSTKGSERGRSASVESQRQGATAGMGVKDPRVPVSILVSVATSQNSDPSHCIGKFVNRRVTDSEEPSNNSSLVTAGEESWAESGGAGTWSAPVSPRASAFAPAAQGGTLAPRSLGEQRAIVAAARAVWAIADTAEQVANMSPNRSATDVASSLPGPSTAPSLPPGTHLAGLPSLFPPPPPSITPTNTNPTNAPMLPDATPTTSSTPSRETSEEVSHYNSAHSSRPVSRVSHACPPTRSDATPPF